MESGSRIPKYQIKGGGKLGELLNALVKAAQQSLLNTINVTPPLEIFRGPDGVAIRLAKFSSVEFKYVKLAAKLHKDQDSDDAVVQSWDGSEWVDGSDTVDVSGFAVKGYYFADEIVPVFKGKDSEYHPVNTGAYAAQATAAANISKGASGNVTVTQSRGTVSAEARIGAVDNGDKLAINWDDAEKKWFIDDAECG